MSTAAKPKSLDDVLQEFAQHRLLMQQELQKVNANLIELPPTGERTYFQTQGKTLFASTPTFATYEDHRMAMAFAPLAMQHPIEIEEPEVVVKSYPDFWKDLQKILQI